MAKYLFDTGFLTLALTERLPEKWMRPWNEIRTRRKVGYVIEPVIAETYYQLMMKSGINKNDAKDYIMEIKSIDSIKIPGLDDNDSFRAGLYHIRFKSFSLVDCFVLAIADRLKLKIYTTDQPLKNAAKEVNILCDYLPI